VRRKGVKKKTKAGGIRINIEKRPWHGPGFASTFWPSQYLLVFPSHRQAIKQKPRLSASSRREAKKLLLLLVLAIDSLPVVGPVARRLLPVLSQRRYVQPTIHPYYLCIPVSCATPFDPGKKQACCHCRILGRSVSLTFSNKEARRRRSNGQASISSTRTAPPRKPIHQRPCLRFNSLVLYVIPRLTFPGASHAKDPIPSSTSIAGRPSPLHFPPRLLLPPSSLKKPSQGINCLQLAVRRQPSHQHRPRGTRAPDYEVRRAARARVCPAMEFS
jgi:hypothetical protein